MINNYISIPDQVISETGKLIGIEDDSQLAQQPKIRKLIYSLTNLIAAIRMNNNQDSIDSIFPKTFHDKLKSLLVKIITELEVKDEDKNLVCPMSRFLDFDYKVIASSGQPDGHSNECQLNLKLSDNNRASDHGNKDEDTIRNVSLRVTAEQLEQMTSGLAKIRDQLFSAAAASPEEEK
jgi:hypothetical protein